MKNFNGTSLLAAAVLTAGFTGMAMAQDECSTAVTAVVGGNAFSTVSATSSADPVSDAQCATTFLDWGTSNKDVWFTFTAPASGLLSLDTCFAGSFDTSMVLYTGTCGALTQVACNGDGTGLAGCQTYYSRIADFGAVAGTTYYIRIGGYNDGTTIASGTGQLNLNFTAVNAGCIGATGNCGVARTTGGCGDPVCCTAVCDFDQSCCDAAWSADCVTYAVDLCGIFVYQCTGANPSVANDCATSAAVITSDTFRDINNNGCNTDGPDHAGADCNSGNDFFLYDVWYRFASPANGTLVVQTCVVDGGPATTFDSKLAVYDMGTAPASFDYNTLNTAIIGCNDDGDSACAAGGGVYPSYLAVNVTAGRSYLIRVASYDNPGTARVTFNVPEPCSPLPANTSTEAEACGDNTNGGCNAGGPVESIAIGAKVKGTLWINDDGAGNLTRDLDWYQLDVTADKNVSFKVYAANFVTTGVFRGDITAANCAGVTFLGGGAGSCPNTTNLCLSPGSYYFVVGMDFAAGATACGSGAANDYVLEVTAVDASCPVIVGATCTSPGADSAWSNNQVPPTGTNNLGGVVACASNPAFPNCSGGGTGANKYARVFTSGQLGGEINCFEVGFFSVKRAANAANTACANYLSDLPLPATVYICRDTDGANPRNIIATAGDGNDLEVLSTRSVLVPGIADTGAINFDPPLCLDGVTGNIVVVLDIPSFLVAQGTVPAASGYGMRAAGTTVTGQSSQVFIRLSCADAAGQFVSAESLGATFTAQWFVGANGTFSGCGSSCPGDFDGDGFITAADLSTLLGSWGTPGGDIDGDGNTTAADLSTLLGSWGACP